MKKTKYNLSEAFFEMAVGLLDQLPESTFDEVVFSGRSNVGKSSLINAIFGRKSLARISSKPGKTGTINFYRINDLYLVDLPGYGYAKVSFKEKKRWAELVESYFNSGRKIKLIVQIIDMRHPPSEKDLEMINFLNNSGFNYIIVLTKSDKLNKSNRLERLKNFQDELSEFKHVKKIPFSCVTKEGLEEIRREIGFG